ncbi:Extracellular basic protease [Andreprevotia sp. IGB-42]|uniref:S8 family peptidase n=1 Tax=Andreprevotia sp. IGB-42 TaxID=2497473 RepID=UPI00157ECD56|nr:S8 family peptidase [Andreprevotia sp. IGB-42]KAF0812976.1 Extracellular basic protease [Andreprevotia sp. IGB-42]
MLSFRPRSFLLTAPLLALSVLLTACVDDVGDNAPQRVQSDAQVQNLIVKMKQDGLQQQVALLSAAAARAVSTRAGTRLVPLRVSATGAQVLALPAPVSGHEAAQIAARIAADSSVEYAEPDVRMTALAVPNDSRFGEQWALREPERAAGGINAVDAWDVTQGSDGIVVAVVDTGILPHADFGGRVLPGYDFISDAKMANDGGGRDSNAADPGDWLTQSEAIANGGNAARSSSWHGTHVAGIIAAQGNNGLGVAGIDWHARILPVRVLGKGGGMLSDITDGIVWAAGGGVPGVPTNPNPARVINMSLGGGGTCSRSYQDAIDYAVARGVVVVVAAGNEAQDAGSVAPASCNNVITVAAVGLDGGRAGYSNYGSKVTLAAPGGNMGRDTGILSLGDRGTTTPQYSNDYVNMQGTSMAAPQVAGVVSLMLAVNPALNSAQVRDILRYSVRQFPTGTGHDCTLSMCGAGLVNAAAAVRAAAAATGGNTQAVPQSGWWWNTSEGGRGFALEIRNGRIFMAGFLYGADGKPTWVVSGGQMRDAYNYSGKLEQYRGGQMLAGSYKAPQMTGTVGDVSLKFTDASHLVMNWPGGQVQLERFDIVPGSLARPQQGFRPDSGWWWNPAEAGSGYAIEVQGDQLFVAGFMYDEQGNPTWMVSSGTMTANNAYAGNWVSYAGGQPMVGSYRAPVVTNPAAGALRLAFSDSRNVVMTLPNGAKKTLTRFDVGVNLPFVSLPSNQIRTSQLLGSWTFSYRIYTSPFTDYFLFDAVEQSYDDANQYYAYGLDAYGDLVIGAYFDNPPGYMIYSAGELIDQVYTFSSADSDVVNGGCYYLIDNSTGRWSNCYSLFGIRTRDGGVSSFANGGQAATARASQEQQRLAGVNQATAGAAGQRLLSTPDALAQQRVQAMKQRIDQQRNTGQ